MTTHIQFYLTKQSIDIVALSAELHDPAAGAVVTFDGRVRDHNEGRRVIDLEYQAYPALALTTGRQILEEESAMHNILRVIAVQRTGTIAIGESAVWVGTASEHRSAAFAATQAIMERLKYELAVWKKETYANGRVEWVGPDGTSPEELTQPADRSSMTQSMCHNQMAAPRPLRVTSIQPEKPISATSLRQSSISPSSKQIRP